jgi:hypothetical protein
MFAAVFPEGPGWTVPDLDVAKGIAPRRGDPNRGAVGRRTR